SGIGFWQRQEIRDVVSLATFLADGGDELALFALLRGPMGQLNDQEILFLSQFGRGSIHRGSHHFSSVEAIGLPSLAKADAAWSMLSAPVQQALDGFWQEMTTEDRHRVHSTVIKLNNWRQRVDRMAHADLLQRCLEESGAYAVYAAEQEGELILANL